MASEWSDMNEAVLFEKGTLGSGAVPENRLQQIPTNKTVIETKMYVCFALTAEQCG